MDADAIVIGAGVAGLAAARSLARRSLRVLLVEGRDRVGGRVWADLGAEFIHGPAPRTTALLREAGIGAVAIGEESWVRGKRGLEPYASDFPSAAAIFGSAYALREDETVDRFLQPFERDPETRELAQTARAYVEGFDAADPSIASARAIADEWRSGVDFSTARPLGGYDPMIAFLHDACTAAGVETRLSTIVRCLRWKRGTVEADVSDARGGSQTLRALAAVVTVPIGVLRGQCDAASIAFNPELPPEKHAAMAAIESGHAIKVVLRFRTRFWEDVHDGRYRNATSFRTYGEPFMAYWAQTPLRNGLIAAWAGGPQALALAESPGPQLIAAALDGFGALFGERELARAECESGAVHDWTADPFARGAYSYVRVGGADARTELAAPLDQTLFFAGEATSTDGQGGTVNGALETGERAAAQAAMALDVKAH